MTELEKEFIMLCEHLSPLIIFIQWEKLAEEDITDRIITHLGALEKIILNDDRYLQVLGKKK